MSAFALYLGQVVSLTREDLFIYGFCTSAVLYLMIEVTDIVMNKHWTHLKKRHGHKHGDSR